jgi:cell cycle checkpoint protein
MDDEDPPVLTAVSSSARQLYLLLRCIAFSNKAHVQINEEGLRFAVDEASVMEGTVSPGHINTQILTFAPSIRLPRQVPLHNLHLPRAASP